MYVYYRCLSRFEKRCKFFRCAFLALTLNSSPGTDTERMLQALSERDEGSEKDEETGDLVRFSQD